MPTRFSLSGALGVSIAAIALTAIFVLVMVPPLVVAALGPGTGASEPGERLSKLVARHDDSAKDSQERFNGRSPFFRPPPKFVPPPPPKDEPKVELPPRDPGPPPPPAKYSGPSLIAIFGDQAWFKAPSANDKTLIINVGTEKAGVKLLETTPPWSVKVTHKGKEYVVDLFSKSYEKYFTANAPKLRSVVPGLIIQAPPMPEAVIGPGQDQASIDAAIEARRLRAMPLDKSHEVDPNAKEPAEQSGEDTDAEDEDAEESGEEAGEDEPEEDAGDPQPDTEPPAPEAATESSADGAVNKQATLTGDESPSGGGLSNAAARPTPLGVPK